MFSLFLHLCTRFFLGLGLCHFFFFFCLLFSKTFPPASFVFQLSHISSHQSINNVASFSYFLFMQQKQVEPSPNMLGGQKWELSKNDPGWICALGPTIYQPDAKNNRQVLLLRLLMSPKKSNTHTTKIHQAAATAHVKIYAVKKSKLCI